MLPRPERAHAFLRGRVFPRGRALVSRCLAPALVLVAVLGLAVALHGLACAVRYRYVFPYWDMASLEAAYFGPNPLAFWVPADNEHLPIFATPLFWLDNVLFSARGLLTQGLVLLFAAGMAAVWAGEARRASRGDLLVTIACAGAFLALTLSLQNWENLIWPKQVHMYLSLASFMAAGWLAARPGIPSRRRLFGIAALLTVAIFSFAYGVVAWVAVLCLGVAARWPWRRLAVLLAVFAGCLLVYALLYNGATIGAYGSPAAALLHPRLIAAYELTYLAAPLIHLAAPWTFGSAATAPVARALTLVLLLALLPLAWRMLRRPPGRTATWSWLLILFTLGTGFISALARARSFGEGQALSSRYFVAQVPLWVGMALLAVEAFGPRARWRRLGVACAGLALVAGLARADGLQRSGLRRTNDDHYRAVLALIDGVEDRAVLQARIQPQPGLAWNLAAALRRRRWSVFSWREPGWLGRRFDTLFASAGPYACDGLIETQTAVAGGSGDFLTGWAWDRRRRAPVTWIVLVDDAGVVRALGRGGLPRAGLGRLLYDRAADAAGWQGYAPPGAVRAFAVVDRGRAACPLVRRP